MVQPVGRGAPAGAASPGAASPGVATPPLIPATIDIEAFNRFEAEGWEAAAGSYEFLRPVTARVIGSLLEAAHVRPECQVLDVGCGPGDLAAAAASIGADTVGIDVAPSMVRRAAIAHPEIPFRVGSFEAIPAGAGTFDALVGNFVINHVGHPEGALAEARRVLRPGGHLALSAWDSPRRNRVLGLFTDAVDAVDAPPPAGVPAGPTNFRSDQELRHLFAAAGFVAIGLSRIMFETTVPDIDTLWRGVLDSAVRIPPAIVRQSPEIRDRIRDAFDRLCAVHRRPDGSYAIPVAVQVVQGRQP